jgi:hypothetical protein
MLKCVSKERNFFLEMSASFDLNHDRLAGDSKFATIASSLSTPSRIDSRGAFNRYCRKACLLWSEHFSRSPVGTSAFFTELLDRIDRRGEGTIKTPWGGVVIVLHEHPRVEKYLVIRQGGYLALEMHEQKDEHLEGAGRRGAHPVEACRRPAAYGGGGRAGRPVPFRARNGTLPDRNGEPARVREIDRSQRNGSGPHVHLRAGLARNRRADAYGVWDLRARSR